MHKREKKEAMSLKPQPIGPIPEETARIARAAYPSGNIYLQLRDTLGTIYEDEQFADLFPQRGQPAETPWRLALVSVLQFLEGLSDRQAADAVRGRLDWNWATPALITRCWSSFGNACSAGSRTCSSLTCCSAGCGREAISKRADASAATPRMCWPRFARSIAWKGWEKPCVPPSIGWRWPLPSGWRGRCRWTG